MKVIGIVGGVASGKTLVTRLLAECGAQILDADGTGHEVLRDHEVRQQIRNRWGTGVLNADGEVDRRALARIVFRPPPEGPRELAELEKITHPPIRQRLQAAIDRLQASGDVPAVVLDAPVLFKAGWDRFCDQIVFVDAPQALRIERAGKRGWSADELAARDRAQLELDAKRQRSQFVIDNSGTTDATRAQVERVWQTVVGPPPQETRDRRIADGPAD